MEVINRLARERHVCGLADFEGSCATMISFKAPEKHLGDVLEDLHRIGVGVNFGSIDIWALQSTKPIMASYATAPGPKRRNYRVHDRMTVEEIFASVDEQSHLTFDYLCNTFVAALIAAVGLLTDSSVTVVASMVRLRLPPAPPPPFPPPSPSARPPLPTPARVPAHGLHPRHHLRLAHPGPRHGPARPPQRGLGRGHLPPGRRHGRPDHQPLLRTGRCAALVGQQRAALQRDREQGRPRRPPQRLLRGRSVRHGRRSGHHGRRN